MHLREELDKVECTKSEHRKQLNTGTSKIFYDEVNICGRDKAHTSTWNLNFHITKACNMKLIPPEK